MQPQGDQQDNLSICSDTTTNTITQPIKENKPSLSKLLERAETNQDLLDSVISKLSQVLNKRWSKPMEATQKV
jgi:hypothetical protein